MCLNLMPTIINYTLKSKVKHHDTCFLTPTVGKKANVGAKRRQESKPLVFSIVELYAWLMKASSQLVS